eukprot:CAMPEP_0175947800 /NCGR_PEP_ID=MMETSP0108-20121206/28095_1 /TAXON_ID=195067 ORGANISM="Goniomonas pacifica, Strain CCMP1869" /NCGR_SAMPLE_ID=MMETSP0108 /ASSEMBLY_ACC=CAM_ASM_000204 /LENGTH=145 /DNA_ID=CAMNT_0017273487 /DNA_START=605 /DNA_END=1042 /DNA_ORIENTATION=+
MNSRNMWSCPPYNVASRRRTTLGCRSWRISCVSRMASCTAAFSLSMTLTSLTATCVPNPLSNALYTDPNAPRPISSSRSQSRCGDGSRDSVGSKARSLLRKVAEKLVTNWLTPSLEEMSSAGAMGLGSSCRLDTCVSQCVRTAES